MSEHHRTTEWLAASAAMRKVLTPQLPLPCIERRCQRGGIVLPGQRWHVGHRVSVKQAKALGWTTAQTNHPNNLGPSHVRCNTSAGGTEGAKARNENRAAARRMPSW